MDTSKLKKFASFARTSLIEQVGTRLKAVLAEQSLARRENAAAVAELEKKIKELGKERVIEMVAYTWFNRFCALRFMDVNGYTMIGTVSPAEAFTQPEILTEAKQGVIDEELKVDRAKIIGLLDGTRPSQDAQGEVYQQLLIAACNSYHKLMPFMFEKIADYTELLIPEDLLSDSSVLAETRKALTVENCADVEVIGWLYQFYISERKDEVFAELKKGKKITPENIPAATQLFTPHWIVRYLVENSLGRLWMLNHPDSKLIERMEYYIRPEEPETEFLKIASPEEIKVCDPACGSGHMLTYAFDLLYEIYREEQYPEPEIPSLILRNNLYGIEIDQRAGALAAFALTMKARGKDKRFFTRKSKPDASGRDFSSIDKPKSQIQNPNICVLENISIDPEDLSAYMDKVGRDLFSDGLQGVVNQWEEADNFGSLIRPLVTDVSEVLELLRERQMGQDLFIAGVHQKVLTALLQADYLSPKYHVVVANPPYMGPKQMNPHLKAFGAEKYPEGKTDFYAMFLDRSFSLVVERGISAFVTMHSWMFLSSFKKFREKLLKEYSLSTLAHLGARAFGSISGEIVAVAAFCFTNEPPKKRPIVFFRLVDGEEENKREALLRKENRFVQRDQAGFFDVPDCPIAYWVDEATRELFRGERIEDLTISDGQNKTTNNDKYVRSFWEIDKRSLGRGKKWLPYAKGGPYRRWYGNLDTVIDWSEEARAFYRSNSSARIVPEYLWYRPAITWSRVGTGLFGFRLLPADATFDMVGSSVFVENESENMNFLLGLLNSQVAQTLLEMLNPSVDLQVKDVRNIPISANLNRSHLAKLVAEAIELSKTDWDSHEVSLDFSCSPLLKLYKQEESLSITTSNLMDSAKSKTHKLFSLEEKINELVAEAYRRELSFPRINDITLECNAHARYGSDKSDSELESLLLSDTMREFISYAVGCMFGRYSLNKPGLILANEGETADDYRKQVPEPTFAPDEDNVIPMLDGDWFADDISERFKEFLKVTFGTEHYEENLTFLENALYPDNLTGKKRKTIRDYFLKDFYNHHIKLYKKRPIYWLFSSPKGTFNALIYMHRYRPDTVGTVLHYLRDFRDKLTHHAEHQQMLADSASASKSEKTQAIKDVAAIKKQLKELEDYEKTLFEVAARKIDIDLDDGVKHNYQLFGSVLRKIPGLDAKED